MTNYFQHRVNKIPDKHFIPVEILKGRGRPKTTGPGLTVNVRCHKDFLRRLDRWRKQANSLSRPEAIRQLAETELAKQESTQA